MSLRFTITAGDATKAAFQAVKNRAEQLKLRFAQLKAQAGGLGKALVAAFSVKLFDSLRDFADGIHKMSIRLGFAAETLSAYKHVADLAGVSLDHIFKGMVRGARSVSEASQGLKKQQEALLELGLHWQDLLNLPIDEQFEIIGDALRSVSTHADKLRLSQDLLGRSGIELITVFNDGAASIAQVKQRAQELNLVFEQQIINNIATMNDDLTELWDSLKAIGVIIIGELAPAIGFLADKLATVIGFIGKLIRTLFLFDDAIVTSAKLLGRWFGLVKDDDAAQSLKDYNRRFHAIWSSSMKATQGVEKFSHAIGKLGKKSTAPSRIPGPTNVTIPQARNDNQNSASNKPVIFPPDDISHWRHERAQQEQEAQRSMDRIKDIFKEGLTDIGRDWKNLGRIASDTLRRIGDVLLQNQIDQLLGGLQQSGGDVLGGLFHKVGSFFKGSLGGAFAEGGNFSAGKPILVGEKGPELIMPRRSGFVIPNHALNHMQQPVQVVMHVHANDAGSFSRSHGQIANEAARAIQLAQARR